MLFIRDFPFRQMHQLPLSFYTPEYPRAILLNTCDVFFSAFGGIIIPVRIQVFDPIFHRLFRRCSGKDDGLDNLVPGIIFHFDAVRFAVRGIRTDVYNPVQAIQRQLRAIDIYKQLMASGQDTADAGYLLPVVHILEPVLPLMDDTAAVCFPVAYPVIEFPDQRRWGLGKKASGGQTKNKKRDNCFHAISHLSQN